MALASTPRPPDRPRGRRLRGLVKSVLGLLKEELGHDRWIQRLLWLSVGVGVVGAAWDLPGAYGWENDGIAPRGVFSGLVESLAPGSANRYPLFHYLLSVLVSVPALLVSPLLAGSVEPQAIAHAVSGVQVMSGVSLLVKLLSVAMSAVTLLALVHFTRGTFGRLAARLAGLFYVLNLSLSYYGRTSNLDGPYLMWVTLLMCVVSPLVSAEPERRGELDRTRCLQIGVFAALAVATKDQAYASVMPLLLVVLLQVRSAATLGRLLAVGTVCYVVCAGVLFNPLGFPARLRLLSGPNSQDYAAYPRSIAGLAENLSDIVRALPNWWWPVPILALSVLGLLMACWDSRRLRSLSPLLPALVAAGCLGLFTLVVRRAEHRFVLPCALGASVYAGVAASRVLAWSRRSGVVFRFVQGALGMATILAALLPLCLLWTQWSDGRRTVRQFLDQVPVGTRVETYGLSVYMPHFDVSDQAPYRVTRVEPEGQRVARLFGVESVRDSYENVSGRRPDLLVIPERFATRFLPTSGAKGPSHSKLGARALADQDAVRFFGAALKDALTGYHLLFVAESELPSWMIALGLLPIDVHGSTGGRTWVLKRSK